MLISQESWTQVKKNASLCFTDNNNKDQNMFLLFMFMIFLILTLLFPTVKAFFKALFDAIGGFFSSTYNKHFDPVV